jgi:hypothetical protein
LEITYRKNNKEIDFWKNAVMEVALSRVVDRPRVEDMIRSILGVQPEKLNRAECD